MITLKAYKEITCLSSQFSVLNYVTGVWMTAQGTSQSGRNALHLNVEPQMDKGCYRCLRQGIASGDIDLPDLWRQAMDDGGQQRLVA